MRSQGGRRTVLACRKCNALPSSHRPGADGVAYWCPTRCVGGAFKANTHSLSCSECSLCPHVNTDPGLACSPVRQPPGRRDGVQTERPPRPRETKPGEQISNQGPIKPLSEALREPLIRGPRSWPHPHPETGLLEAGTEQAASTVSFGPRAA